jgi:tRNA A37 threonylcarbamoyladenosine biosynthesis protein TsaE
VTGVQTCALPILKLCHVDLYRIEGSECEPLNIEEFLEQGVVAVEWAERGSWWDGIIRVDIRITGEEERIIIITKT